MARPAHYRNPPPQEEGYADALIPAAPGKAPRGRAAGLNPANRFATTRLHVLGEHWDAAGSESAGQVQTHILPDKTQHLINRVDSPDVGFDWTLNPYRGCEHGCIYCYARAYHEYLGYSCGLDFETRILAKLEAPRLLRRELAAPSWRGETIIMSGITDCWQPLDLKLKLARACLEVLVDFRQPVALITRSRRILRDLDLIQELHRHRAVRVNLSLTTLAPRLAAKMEPRASAPQERLKAIAALAKAGVPVMVMVAPVIPGLTDREIPAILQAAAEAGAHSAEYALVRLPYQVKALFLDWLKREQPLQATRVESLIRGMRSGQLYDSRSGIRNTGQGVLAKQIQDVFQLYARRAGLDKPLPKLNHAAFRKPASNGQMDLFGT